MKKIFSIFLAISVLAGLSLGVTSCFQDQPELIETLELGGCLTPTSTSVTVSTETGDDVTFTWSNSKGATQYILEIYEIADRSATAEEVYDDNPEYSIPVAAMEGSSTSYTMQLPAGKLYRARVKAQQLDGNGDPVIADSKWAIFENIAEPSLIREAIPSFEVTARTDASITVAWTIAEGDEEGLDHIRVYPNPDDPAISFKEYSVTSGTSLEITGLTPSTKYTLAAHYQSANRGEVYAWTRPSLDNPTRVKTTEELQKALADGAPVILVEYSATPYELYTTAGDITAQAPITVPAEGAIAIYGEGNESGDMPVLNGYFDLPNGLKNFHVEGVTLNGEGYKFDRAINIGTGFATDVVENISMLNCNVTGYRCGIYYDNVSTSTFNNISFKSIYVTDIQGAGGDGFDIRKACTVKNFSVTESTFSKDMRALFRMDANVTAEKITITNNTFNSICATASIGENKGVLYVRAKGVTEFTVNNNLFLNITGDEGRSRLFRSASGLVIPTSFTGNYCYNIGESFWAGTEATLALATSATILGSDPCVDSQRGILNVTSAVVSGAKAGDPRWFETYVPAPTPELEPVEYGYKWDLTDDMTFYETVDASTVRGNTEFFIGSDPINVTDKGFEFTGAASLAYGGVPTSSAIAFLVDGPGSIYASTLVSGSNYGGHIAVAVGPTSGISATVVGSLYAGAVDAKVVFEDIVEPQIIYLYAGGPIVLSALEWSSDLSSGIMPIDAPSVTPSAGEGTLSLAWDAVDGAGEYIISFGSKEPDAEYGETEYTISTTSTSYSWKDFPSGTWTVNVQAIAAEPTKAKNSDIAGTSVTVTAPAQLPELSSGTITQEDMAFLYAVTGGKSIDGTNITNSIYYKGFLFTGHSGKKFKFINSEVYGAAFNAGGDSGYDLTNPGRTIRFVAAGAGKLTYVTCSNGTVARGHTVAVNAVKGEVKASLVPPTAAPVDWTDYTYTTELSTVAGDIIDLGGQKDSGEGATLTNGNVNFISVTWTLVVEGGIPSDPEAVEEQTDFMSLLKTAYTSNADLAEAGATATVDKITYVAKSDKAIQWDAASKRIKLQGASPVDETTGLPTGNYLAIKITKPGTLKHYVRSGSSSATDAGTRSVKIDLVMNDGASVVNLYNQYAPTGGYSAGKEVSTEITAEHLSATNKTATLYLYAPVNSVNIYYLEFIPAE